MSATTMEVRGDSVLPTKPKQRPREADVSRNGGLLQLQVTNWVGSSHQHVRVSEPQGFREELRSWLTKVCEVRT
jgi:hypothetical protein